MKKEISYTAPDKFEEEIPGQPEETGKSLGLEKEKILEKLRNFFDSQFFAALVTQNGNAPYLSLVAFASSQDLTHLLFSTTKNTRKYSNLLANPEVSLLIDNRKNSIEDFKDAMAVTALGRIEPLEGSEQAVMEKVYLAKHPYLIDFLRSPTTAFLKIRIEKYIIVTRFQHVVELSV